MAKNEIQLPENFDPYDMALKKKFNYLADDKNFIGIPRKRPQLLCGAHGKQKGKPCTNPAGFGTDHVGYGRCKYHGGGSTGPKTEEGKAKVGQNSTLHGLYASVLLPREREIFEGLVAANKAADLEIEIQVMKAKILGYLEKWRARYIKEEARAMVSNRQDPEATAERNTRVYFTEGQNGTSHYYQAGSIEDRTLDRALNTLRRLVEAQLRLNPEQGDSLLDQINAELKAASEGQVAISWSNKPQTREGGK
jgi:hypothetical protein